MNESPTPGEEDAAKARRKPRRAKRLLPFLALGVLAGGGIGAYYLRYDLHLVPTAERNTVRDDQRAAAAGRPWCAPVEVTGVENCFRVSDDLYRGEQPTAEGFRQLKAMGIKTVVNLRAMHTDRPLLGQTGLACESIPIWTWHAEDEDMAKFIRIVTDKDRTPVFVHCQHGSDRTGTACAVYRVVVCGWTPAEALDEMRDCGAGFHEMWGNLVQYVTRLDAAKIRRLAGQVPASRPDGSP